MDRRNFYFKQPVTESELDGAFDAVEEAIWRLVTDQQVTGIAQGMVVAQTSPSPTMAVTVSGPGYAYDSTGERIFIPAPWQPQPNGLDLTNDSNLVPTAVSTGNERWIAVFVKFARALSDPRVDGSSNTVYFQANESFTFTVVQGVEATLGTAIRVTPDPSFGVLLCDVHRTAGQTSIQNTDIDTTRRQDAFVISQSPFSVRAGTVLAVLTQSLQNLNNHVLGSAGQHADTAITSVARSGTPLALGAGTVGSQLAALLAYIDGPLQSTLAGLSGGLGGLTDTAIASPARSGSPLSLSAGTVGSQLDAIRAYIDGGLQTTISGINSSITSIDSSITSIESSISSLADTSVSSVARAGSPLALSAGTVGSQLDAIRSFIDSAFGSSATFAALTATGTLTSSGGLTVTAGAIMNAAAITSAAVTTMTGNPSFPGSPTFSSSVSFTGGATLTGGILIDTAAVTTMDGTPNFAGASATFSNAAVFLGAAGTVVFSNQFRADNGMYPGTDNTGQVGTDANRFALVRAVVITSGDLKLTDEARGCDWLLREQQSFILAVNRRTGERFKLATQPLTDQDEQELLENDPTFS